MNTMAYRLPDRVYRNDSCPRGLGGYSDEGYAWRWEIPEELRFRASNNLLEHLANIITPWIDILAGRLTSGMCKLSMSDSTTSVGWMKKSNFNTDPLPDKDGNLVVDPVENEVRTEACRLHALLCLENNIKDFSQWFRGKENDVSDSLSRDHHIDDKELTNLLQQHFPQQVPEHLEIVPLPNEIVSWLTSVLQRLPVKPQLQEKHTTTNIEHLNDGKLTSPLSESDSTHSSKNSQDTNETSLLERLPWLCGRGDFRDQLMTPWLRAQSEIPSHLWARPSGRTDTQTQPLTKIDSLACFYSDSSAPSETKIPHQNNKLHSR